MMALMGSLSGVHWALIGAGVWGLVYAAAVRWLRTHYLDVPSAFLVMVGVGVVLLIATVAGVLPLEIALALLGMFAVSGVVMAVEQLQYLGAGQAKKVRRMRGDITGGSPLDRLGERANDGRN